MLSRKISAAAAAAAAPGVGMVMVMGTMASGGGAAAGGGAGGSSVGAAAAGGIDRGRVGERLQAALAGLHELRLLREKQGDMVRWALQQRLDREEPTTSNPSSASTTAQTTTTNNTTTTTMRGSMLANEEQRLEATLTALKQQLGSPCGFHSPKFDLLIQPCSFYELSDGGSCSLSNSCTSVYSECLSSSQTSLLQSPGSAPTSHNNNNTTTAAAAATTTATAAGPNVVPVNGDMCHRRDLDRMLTAGPGCYKSPPVKTPAMGPAPRTSTVDTKFQSSLMSRNGAEVYHYPSPLHAVALQSPIFSLAGEPSVTAEGQGPSADPKGQETRCLGYIGTLLQRNSTARTSRSPEWSHLSAPAPEALDLASLEAKWERECRPDPVTPTPPTSDPAWRCQDPESLQRYSYPAAIRECSVAEDTTTVNHQDKLPAEHAAQARNHREKRHPSDARRETRVAEKKYPAAQKPVLSHSSSSTEETRAGWEGQGGNDFVHAKFVPAGAQHVKVRQADRKTKAVKLRKKAGEKPRAARHQQHQQQHAGYSSGERARETQVTTGCRGEVAARSGRAKASPRLGEQRKHSGSDSSLCGPWVHALPQGGKGPQNPSARRPSNRPRNRIGDGRQGTGRWPPVDAEAFRSRALRGPGRTARWTPATRRRRTPGGLPPATRPRCESEYSAECASLFHSTIAASSVGDLSDDTTNRFGDSESSQSFSDSDSSLSLEEEEENYHRVEGGAGALVWAQSAQGPTAAAGVALRRPPHPEAPACRIKASRALKKKIRRFQPATLKVMTLV
ncbi:hypothetical protein CRUP_018542 [Coryphaenoides rupestris]|nr:hypothetical protein CRUP_018542 [Coryphaenoides rupestris]